MTLIPLLAFPQGSRLRIMPTSVVHPPGETDGEDESGDGSCSGDGK
jgi:hypothetical protein